MATTWADSRKFYACSFGGWYAVREQIGERRDSLPNPVRVEGILSQTEAEELAAAMNGARITRARAVA